MHLMIKGRFIGMDKKSILEIKEKKNGFKA